MDFKKPTPTAQNSTVAGQSPGYRFRQWAQDPLGSIIVASVATIGSFGVVLSGMWFISLILS